MNVGEVKKVLLDAIGNPESGVIADYADVLSEAVVKAYADKKCCQTKVETKTEPQARELRIVKPDESR